MQDGSYVDGLGKDVSGEALARASGNFQAQSQIGQAKGLIASGVYDIDGDISHKDRVDANSRYSTEVDLLQRGFENQSRMNVNQIAGIGKEDLNGEEGVEKMNAIQYASHAGIKGQIAQGKALKETFGVNLNGSQNSLGMSYDTMALNNAENQLSSSVAQAKAFRAEVDKHGDKHGLRKIAIARETNAEDAMNKEIKTGLTTKDEVKGYTYSSATQSQASQDASREREKALLDKKEEIFQNASEKHKEEAKKVYEEALKKYNEKYLDKDGNIKQFDDRLSADDIASTQAKMNVASMVGSTMANQKYLNEAGFSGVASNIATSTDMQNIKSAQTAQSAREEFGDVVGGGGNGSYKDVAYQQAAESHQSSKGHASQFAQMNKIEENGKTTAENMAALDVKNKMGAFQAGMQNIKNKEKGPITYDEALEQFSQGIIASESKKMAEAATSGKTLREKGIINKDGSIADMNYLEGVKTKITEQTQENIENTKNFQKDFVTGADEQLKKIEDKVRAESRTKFDVLGSPEAMWNHFTGKESYSELNAKLDKYNQKLQEGLSNTQELQQAARDNNWHRVGELNAHNKIEMMSGGVVSSFNSQKGQLQGSSQSGVSFSHNESSNHSYGTNVSGGSVFAGTAQGLGMSMASYGAMSSSVAAAGAVMGAVGTFMPGGVLGKAMSNLGAINPESTYAMGIGSHSQMKTSESNKAISKMNSVQSNINGAKSSVSQAQKQYDFAKEQRALEYKPVGRDYEGWSSQKLGAESARLQQKNYGLEGSIRGLSEMAMNYEGDDPTRKSINRQVHKLTNEKQHNAMRIKYLKLAQDEIIAGERLEMAKQNLKHSYKERNLTISQLSPHQRQEWDKSEFNPDKRKKETDDGELTIYS